MLPAHRYYYLHNFERALAWIGERHGDLLDGTEQRFLARFGQLPRLSRALIVRLLMRRGPWFRAGKLAYEEIPDPVDAAAPLLALGWLNASEPMALEELFALHTKTELLRLFADEPIDAGMRKAEMLDALHSVDPAPRTYCQWHPQTAEPAWRVMIGELTERLRLMFFGNLHQDWSAFVLTDLGIFKYETVPFDARSRAFQTRADLDVYLTLHTCHQALDQGADIDDLLQRVARCETANAWLERRRAKVLLRIGQSCERARDWARADRAYAQSTHPDARHRRMRVHERAGRVADAMALALAARAAPLSDEESQRVARMLPRLRRNLGLGPERPPVAHPVLGSDGQPAARTAACLAHTRTDIALAAPSPPFRVEHALRDHWHTDAAPVFYVENALINSLFGLLCWPAIFQPLPGAFFHPFQSGPADLGAPDFVQRRARAFDQCLDQLDDGTYRDVILRRFTDKRDLLSPFVFWGILTKRLLRLALDCIPAAHLNLFFRHLLRDVTANRAGLPDLVRFWPAERRYELVEVKGPGDRLQDNQIRWLRYCVEHDIPVRVCHVRWCEAPVVPEPAVAVSVAMSVAARGSAA